MRVLMIVASFPPSRCGVGDYTEQLCKNLVADGVEVLVVTSNPKSRIPDPEPRILKVYPVVKRWGFGVLFPILKLIKRIRPEVIHIQYHGDDYERRIMINLLPFILRLRGYQTVTTLHNLQPPSIFPELGMEILLKFSKRLILTNEIDRNKLIKEFPFTACKAVVIPAGPGTPKIQNSKFKIRNSKDETLLSYFGFINPSKGIETLFLALANLIKEGRKVRLLIIGDLHDEACKDLDGYAKRLKELARDLKIENFIIWTGYVDKKDASSYLLSSDICVLPFRDGASTKRSSLISCLDHGLPVVTTCNGSIPKGMQDHKNIVFIKPDDHEGLACALRELIDDKGLRDRLAKAAEELVKREYSWKGIVRRTVEIYEGTL